MLTPQFNHGSGSPLVSVGQRELGVAPPQRRRGAPVADRVRLRSRSTRAMVPRAGWRAFVSQDEASPAAFLYCSLAAEAQRRVGRRTDCRRYQATASHSSRLATSGDSSCALPRRHAMNALKSSIAPARSPRRPATSSLWREICPIPFRNRSPTRGARSGGSRRATASARSPRRGTDPRAVTARRRRGVAGAKIRPDSQA